NVTTDGQVPLSDGVHTITARQVINGVETPDSAPLKITIDTQAPTTPSGADLEAASDSGASNSDNITNAQTLLLDVHSTEAGKLHLENVGAGGTGASLTVQGAGTSQFSVPIPAAGFLPAKLSNTSYAANSMV